MVQIDLLFKLAGLGVVVAVIRTGHDQQRKGKHNPVLAVLNLLLGGTLFGGNFL